MAITVERMVAVLEARMDQFDKSVAKSRAQAVGDFQAITTAGDKMEASLARLGSNGKKGFDGVSKSLNSVKGQTGNLAAQFNDIGVQLAGGQSPLLIALQQGTQITQVLGQAGARGAVTALGGAFVSLLNPVSLATIAAITLGGTMIQYFTGLVSAGADSEETLKRHKDLISEVSAKWGDSLPEVARYNAELKAQEEAAKRSAAVDVTNQAQWEKAAEASVRFNSVMDETISYLQKMGASNSDISTLIDAFVSSKQAIEEHNLDAAKAKELQDALNDAFKNSAINGIEPFKAALDGLIDKLGTSIGLVGSLAARAEALEKSIAAPVITEDRETRSGLLDRQGTVADHEQEAARIQREREKALQASSSSSNTDPYASATESLVDRTKALEAQRAAQASINPLVNDYGYALEKAKAQQELLSAAEKAGKEITPQLAAEVDRIAEAYARTSVELAKLAEEHKAAQQAIQFQKDLLNGALSDMRSALEDGKLTWEDLGTVAVNVLNKIADKLQSMLVDQLFDQGFGGLFGSLLGGGFKANTTLGGFLGAVPSAGAKVLSSAPKLPAAASMAKASGVHVTVGVSADNNGNLKPFVEKISNQAAGKAYDASTGQFKTWRKAGLNDDVGKIMRSPRIKGRG